MATLTAISWVFIVLGLLTGLAILVDVRRHPQPMSVMNITWPINGLYAPIFGWWVYKGLGRPDALAGGHTHKPKWQSVAVSVTHCSGGCVSGDSIAAPIVSAVGFTVLGSLLLGHFVGEFIAAYLFGILFQILPIMSMGETNPFKALMNAIKADTLSLVAFEIGMFGWIAFSFLVLLPHEPEVTSPVFWFMMQIAMIVGFLTAYPANWYLVKVGIKHGM
ncbi:DUF4396 domain-containing protein [Salinisphaera hydrothermalis]|uniref:DUF4396 domain-containing protein n=1 Tax=Salinisphaera hydrothermalis TaxID=563188 RepID=UPI003341C780